jgi:hypothetical protein
MRVAHVVGRGSEPDGRGRDTHTLDDRRLPARPGARGRRSARRDAGTSIRPARRSRSASSRLEAAGATVEVLRLTRVLSEVPRAEALARPARRASVSDARRPRRSCGMRSSASTGRRASRITGRPGRRPGSGTSRRKLGVAVDLSHLPRLYRWRRRCGASPCARSAVAAAAAGDLRRQPPLMARFLNDCEARATCAAHHADWLRSHGVGALRIPRTPVPSPLAHDGPTRSPSGRRPTRILLLGHLKARDARRARPVRREAYCRARA